MDEQVFANCTGGAGGEACEGGMIAALSFFELGMVLGLVGVLFFCVWAFVRTLKAECRRRPFEDHELREWLAHAQAKKRALAAREVRL